MTADLTERVARAVTWHHWMTPEAITSAVLAVVAAAVRDDGARVLRDAEDEWGRLHADADGMPPTRSQWQAHRLAAWAEGRSDGPESHEGDSGTPPTPNGRQTGAQPRSGGDLG